MEDAIKQPDLAQSVQKYQLAVDQAKVRLNLAVASHGVANASKHDNKHNKRGRLQQQAQTGDTRDEARGQQRVEHGNKKGRAKANARRALQNQPPKTATLPTQSIARSKK